MPGEEKMRSSLTASSAAYKAADADGSNTLDYAEFCAMPSNKGKPPAELKRLFDEADADGSGHIDRHEYLCMALVEALSASNQRVIDLFEQLDADNSRRISKGEFRKAVKRLGFEAAAADVDLVFAALDEDGSGEITHKELAAALRPSTVALNRHSLRNRLSAKRLPGPKPAGGVPAMPPPAEKARGSVHAAPPSPTATRSYACAALGLEQPDDWRRAAAVDVAAFAIAAAWAVALARLAARAVRAR